MGSPSSFRWIDHWHPFSGLFRSLGHEPLSALI